MNRQVSVVYSREILKSAVLHFWLRFVNWHGFLVIGVMAGLFLYFLLSGERSWLLGVTGTLAVLGVLSNFAVYYVYLRRALDRFEQMKWKTVEITFTDEHFGTKSDLGSGTVPWTSIRSVWRFSDVWLLFLSWNSFVSLPVEPLDEELKVFIVEQVKGHGGKVVWE